MTRFNCPGCGRDEAVSPDFQPVHFTGKLARLSEGYCTAQCARDTLTGLHALNMMSGFKMFGRI